MVRYALFGAFVSMLVACGGGAGAACMKNADCTNSFCNASWKEGASCKADSDCPGYEAKALGYAPPAPNKRCVAGVCHQVGICSNDHS